MNKLFFTLLCSLLCSTQVFVFAQTAPQAEGCGTIMPAETLEWIEAHQFYRNTPNNDRDIKYVPIQFHIVGTSQGTGYFPADDVFRLLCQLNEKYIPVGMFFYLESGFSYINNSNYYEHDFNDGGNMMDQYNVSGRVNVYIVKDPAGNCGYFSPSNDAVAVAQSCSGNNSTTLAHELGHFFSLPHTFSGWEGAYDNATGELIDPIPNNQRERANGSNCGNTADRFCDTPADYTSYRWGCPGPFFTDPTGVQFKPDGTLYMSYSSDVCQNRFSNQQIASMRTFLVEERSNLLGSSVGLNFDAPNATYAYYPANNSQNVNNNHVLFSWKNSGADKYYLEAIQYDDNNGDNLRVFVEDTFYVANLDANYNYYWAVIPVNSANTCSNVAGGYFRTGPANAIYLSNLSVTIPNCNGNTNGGLIITPAGGQAPYSYEWNNGATANILSDVHAAIYTVTITDSNGATQSILVNVPQPATLNITPVQTDNFAASATVTGGTPNYTIQWQNGTIGTTATGLALGSNTVVVTDDNGCSTSKEVSILGIQTNGATIPCYGETASISLTLLDGIEPYQYDWSTNATTSSINNLTAGTYTVTITDQGNANAVLTYNIVEPAPINTVVQITGNTAYAQPTGGTPPYTYYWPTGLTDIPVTSGLPPFTYELFVYDANNCFQLVNFTITQASGIGNNTASDYNISPSILTRGTNLNFSNNSPNAVQLLNVYNANGQVVFGQSNITQNLSIPTNNWASGMYLVQWISNKGIQTAKIIVQ